MKRILNIALSVTVWTGLFVYLVVAARMCERENSELELTGVRVVVADSAKHKIITPGMVKLWLSREGIDARGKKVAELDTEAIRQMVLGHLYVKDARVYTNLRGELTVELTQRRPIMRVNTYNGYNFYVTDDNYILPLQSHEVLYVPVVTGVFVPPFERGYVGSLDALTEDGKKLSENSLFLSKLINFVQIIGKDDFWTSEIVQINVLGGEGVGSKEPRIEIVPRTGNHLVTLGTLDGAEDKLARLLLFYRRALRYEGWDGCSRINVEFENQVICT